MPPLWAETVSWVKLDDGFFGNPKTGPLSKGAKLLYLAGLTYCAKRLTDGKIDARGVKVVRALAEAGAKAVAELEKTGRWEKNGSGYIVHDYLDYNPSREESLAQREFNTARLHRRRDLYSDVSLTQQVRARDGDYCRYCSRIVNWQDRRGEAGGTYDHVDPDGPNSPENIVVSCRRCNSKKGKRTPDQAGIYLKPVGDLPLTRQEPIDESA